MSRRPVQVPTLPTSTAKIMRSRGFLYGVDDVRCGRPPRFDEFAAADKLWSYERGRVWAVLAPRGMPVFVGRRLNPKAVALFNRQRDIL
jgi:hypothetical protein